MTANQKLRGSCHQKRSVESVMNEVSEENRPRVEQGIADSTNPNCRLHFLPVFVFDIIFYVTVGLYCRCTQVRRDGFCCPLLYSPDNTLKFFFNK
jgi:hypothetical protein